MISNPLAESPENSRIDTQRIAAVSFSLLLLAAPVALAAGTGPTAATDFGGVEDAAGNGPSPDPSDSVIAVISGPDNRHDTSDDPPDSSEDIVGWTPPPPPPGLDITPIQYLDLWGQTYNSNESEILLEEAGFSESQITKGVKQQSDIVSRGTTYSLVAHHTTAEWNAYLNHYAADTNESVSHVKWNTGRSSDTKDGSLYLEDVQYDLTAIEPSTIVTDPNSGDPDTHGDEIIYVAGDTIGTHGTFDYRIDEPDNSIESGTRTLFDLEETEVQGPDITLDMDSGGIYTGSGSTASSTTATEAQMSIPDSLSGTGELTSEVEVEVSYTKTVETEICPDHDDDDDDDDESDNNDGGEGIDPDDPSDAPSARGGDDNDDDRVDGGTSGGGRGPRFDDSSGGDDDDDDDSSSGDTDGGRSPAPEPGGGSVVSIDSQSNSPSASHCYWEQESSVELSDTVTVSNTEEVRIGNGDEVTARYWEPKSEAASGYMVLDTPDHWATIQLADGTTLSDPRGIYTERDKSYGLAEARTDDDEEYYISDYRPARNYFIGTSETVSITSGSIVGDAGSDWAVGLSDVQGDRVTQDPPSLTSQGSRSPEFIHADEIRLSITQQAASPDTDIFADGIQARGPAPGQNIDTETDRAGVAIKGNVTAEYVDVNNGTEADPDYHLKITTTEEGSGDPIVTRNYRNIRVKITDLGSEGQVSIINTDVEGEALVDVDDTSTVEAEIVSEFDPVSNLYIEPDYDRASQTNVSGFFGYLLSFGLWFVLALLPLIVAIATLELAIKGKITLMGFLS